MIAPKKRQSLNVSVVVLVGYEMKAIVLVDWVIDAPVGNNLCILFCGRNGYAKNANNQFCGDVEKSAITRVASASRSNRKL